MGTMGIFVVFAIDSYMEKIYVENLPSKNYRTVPKATVAIVPGASVYGLKPSAVLIDRLRCALYLYQNKRVRKILLSGDNGQADYNELKPMLLFMLNNGVKQEDIFVDHAGFRTLDTIVRAKAIYQVEDAIFVSQQFHQPRAFFIASKIGMRLYSYESDMRIYVKSKNFRIREVFARTLTWLDFNILNTSPKFFGEPYPIQGSGKATWKGSIL
ncbi:MAG: YdcF family protein [Leptospira sp.]|nr:YdcF family protein [Leptospira sp.]